MTGCGTWCRVPRALRPRRRATWSWRGRSRRGGRIRADTDTLWFDVAVVTTIFAFGSVLFGRFEEHKPRGRRVLKVALVLAVTVLLSATAGRAWRTASSPCPCSARPGSICNGPPKHGISGWTAEPREEDLELLESPQEALEHVMTHVLRAPRRSSENAAGRPYLFLNVQDPV